MPDFPPAILLHPRRFIAAIPLCSLLIALAGCNRFRPGASADYVYVTVKQIYLRDRVAVVANHVAEVTNGERLKVIEPGRRFMEVETPQGAVGWIESHAVIDQNEFDQFQNLAKQHASQPPVATAVLYNELYIHLAPGRRTQRFYLLPPNTKVSMLERASVPRVAPGSILGLPTASPKPQPVARSEKARKQSFESQFLPAAPMEDWWLVRDSSGRTGWMLSRDLAVDVPEDVAQYAESERMIGAYVLRTVEDPDSGKPGGKVPEYVTVLTPYKEGLPYDFDQVRVFTWDTRRHRYGTAFRLRDVAGFFPVKVRPGDGNNPAGPEPVFTFQAAVGNDVALDPQTGMAHAAQLETMTYRLEGNLVRKVLPPGAPAKAPEAREIHHSVRHGRHHRHRVAR
ncbi:MAG: SH3 domain-containing protein [Acidobacteriaceae bacterium]